MPGSLTLPTGLLYALLLVLVRVGGALVFVPMPGLRGVPETVRVAFALSLTLALFSRWPSVDAAAIGPGTLVAWAFAEAAVGIAIGVAVAIVLESFAVAAQILGIQAGYAYASTIDPNTEADSGVLLVFAQLMAAMLFFALGLDREVVRLFADSLERIPPGTYVFGPNAAQGLVHLGGNLLAVGLRLAMPVVALLLMVDMALALLGRLHSQLQLLSVAFPIKMLLALLVLSWVATLFPKVLLEFRGQAWSTLRRIGI